MLLLYVVLGGELRELSRDEEHERGGEYAYDGQGRVEHQHGDERGYHGDGRVDGLGYDLAYELAERVDVVRVHGHDVAVCVGVEVLYRQGLHLGEELVAQQEHGALADVDHQSAVAVGGHDAGGHDAYQLYDVVEELGEEVRPGAEHGLDVVRRRASEEGRAYDAGDGVNEYADYYEHEYPLILVEHVLYDAVQQGQGALYVPAAGFGLVHVLLLLSARLVEVAAAVNLALIDVLIYLVRLKEVSRECRRR